MADAQGRLVFVSRRAVEMYGGQGMEDLVGKPVADLVVEEDRPRMRQRLAQLLAVGILHAAEYTLVRKDRTRLPIEVSSAMVRDAAGKPKALIALVRDISERKQAEAALQRERINLWHMLQASDHERRLIAYEIHDGLAQRLASALMRFEKAAERSRDDPEDVESALAAYAAAIEMVRQAHQEARRLISGVRPPILDEAGIVPAIEHLAQELHEVGGPEVDVYSEVSFDRLEPTLENCLYRIVQEALTNARKHSRSPKVRVALVQENDVLRLEISDWGIGFDAQTVVPGRFGLRSMRERARLLGGQCVIDSQPGQGTRIHVVLPVLAPRPSDNSTQSGADGSR